MESITGYNIIEAESLEAAEKLAQSNPFIASIRIYEVRSSKVAHVAREVQEHRR